MNGGGDVCAALLSLGEGEREGGGRRELEGERGSVGEKDRVPEQCTSLTHGLTESHIHTYIGSPVVLFFGVVDYFPKLKHWLSKLQA